VLKDRTGFVRHQVKELLPRERGVPQQETEDEVTRLMEFSAPGFGHVEWRQIATWICQAAPNPEGSTQMRIWVLDISRELRPMRFRLACAQLGLSREQRTRINATLNRQLLIEGCCQLKIMLQLH
jgi:hypothetical protein